jgi:hypothetical protein
VGLLFWVETSAGPLFIAATRANIKGIVSRKFYVRFLVSFARLEVSTPFLFLKISSFSQQIFEYSTFSGGVLLSHNTVNELCYVAQFVNSIVT